MTELSNRDTAKRSEVAVNAPAKPASGVDISALVADLTAEGDELDALVSNHGPSVWRAPTPAKGWTVAHQIAHLASTDRAALLAATDPDTFRKEMGTALAEYGAALVDREAERGAAAEPADLVTDWRRSRSRLAHALNAVPAGTRLPWFGPSMGPASMATARLMETWAHGQDIADALLVTREPTDRLRHVAHIGVRTVGFAFAMRDLPVPAEPFRVELTGPQGQRWEWGPPEATDRITGPAEDFCLLVTQRRHFDDLALTVHGEHARQWVPIAQAFAGPAGDGRKAGRSR